MSAHPPDTPSASAALLKALQAANLALRPGPGGSLQAGVDKLELRQLALRTPAGTVEVAKATLTQAVVQLVPGRAGAAFELLALAAEELLVETAELYPSPPPPRAAEARGAALSLEPLGTLQGRLTVSIRDARWAIDAEITLPVVAGRIDFDRVVVEHVGPNSSMGVAAEGIYVEAPDRGRTELVRFTAPGLPGVRYEQRGGFIGRVTDRGSLDLRAFVEAVVNAGAAAPLGRPAGGDMDTLLQRTRLAGDLQLADGRLGTDRRHVVLAERAQGRNGVALSAAVLGQRLVLKLPELAASHGVFEWQGRAGAVGPIAASVEAHVTGLGGAAPEVQVKLHRLSARGLKLGNPTGT